VKIFLYLIDKLNGMAFLKYFQRVKRLDDLIKKKATGGPNDLAKKMHLSRSILMDYLSEMKSLGFPIKFCKHRNSYYYENDWQTEDKLIKKVLTREQQSNLKGGNTISHFVHLDACRLIAC